MADLARHVLRLLDADEAEPDAALLARFIAGRDEAAFAALVRRHGPMVLGVCRRVLRHRQDAEDAFQATFLVLARRASSVRRRGMLGSWLYGVAYRTALAARRLAAARKVREDRAGAMREAERTAPDDSPQPDLAEALDRELAALPDVYRAAVVACHLEGLSRREAAARLGWPEGTLSTRLSRARALLARRLSRFGLAVNGVGFGSLVAPEAVAVEVVETTARFGVLVAAGEAAVAAPVAALVEGTMKAMLAAKLKGVVAAGVAGAALLVTTAAGWRAESVADDRKAADPPVGKKADAPRNPVKDRIAELEKERDELRGQVADLKDRLLKSEADQKKALSAARLRAAEAAEALDRAARERDAARPAPPAAGNPDQERADLRKELTDVKDRLAEMEKQQKAVMDELKKVARAAAPAPAPVVPGLELLTPPALDPPAPVRASNTPPPVVSFAPDPVPPARPVLPAPGVTAPRENVPEAKPTVRVYAVPELAAEAGEGEALAKVVRATVAPQSWTGDAGIEYLPGPKLLVVRQTKAGQEEVEELLKVLKVHAESERRKETERGK
jgi:RNA polymerase sigma factor (sigma-70 family)